MNIAPADGIEGETMAMLSEESFDSDAPEIENRAEDSRITPVVEILGPEIASIDPDRLANMAVNRTQISIGLTGISFNRTRMSGASGQSMDGHATVGQAPAGQMVTSDVKSSSVVASTKADPPASTSFTSASSGPVGSALGAAATSTISSTGSTPVRPAPANSAPAPDDEPDFENVQLFSQFLVGAVAYGVDSLMDRIRFFNDQIANDPAEYDLDKQIIKAEEEIEMIFRYWVIGTLLWGERTTLSVSYRTFQKSLNIGGFVLRTADRATNNFLLRPVRRPFDRLSAGLRKDAVARIDEGRNVERRGRVLAEYTVNDIVGDFIDYLSQNPELVGLISESGMGLAGNVMDSGRQMGAFTDTLVENMLRRVFRRPKREDLPPSPFDGLPQTMYDPINQIESHETKAESKQ